VYGIAVGESKGDGRSTTKTIEPLFANFGDVAVKEGLQIWILSKAATARFEKSNVDEMGDLFGRGVVWRQSGFRQESGSLIEVPLRRESPYWCPEVRWRVLPRFVSRNAGITVTEA